MTLFSASLFAQDATKMSRVTGDAAAKLANQLFYGCPPSQVGPFRGYAGMGYAGVVSSEKKNPQLGVRYSAPLWIVPKSQPRVKMHFVKRQSLVNGKRQAEEELDLTKQEKLGSGWEHVPVPFLTYGQYRTYTGDPYNSHTLGGYGTDEWFTIYCPETDEIWEGHRTGIFQSGTYKGQWKLENGHYQKEVSKWSGAAKEGTGTGTASGLAQVPGMITMSDLVRVLAGGEIGHALSLTGTTVVKGHISPATAGDEQNNERHRLPNGLTNPAYGWVDAVPEGLRCAFPPNSRASEHALTGLAAAVYEAGRQHGFLVAAKSAHATDTSSSHCGFSICDPSTLFTSYCDTIYTGLGKVDPFRGTSTFDSFVNQGTTEAQRAEWKAPASLLNMEFNGWNVMSKQPWRLLEQVV